MRSRLHKIKEAIYLYPATYAALYDLASKNPAYETKRGILVPAFTADLLDRVLKIDGMKIGDQARLIERVAKLEAHHIADLENPRHARLNTYIAGEYKL